MATTNGLSGHMQQLRTEEPFSYQNLLYELVLALSGYTGDVFVDEDDVGGRPNQLKAPNAYSIRLAPDISWVEERDREPFNQVLRLAYHYKQLKAFVDGARLQRGCSNYMRALASGIAEFLAVYQDEVLGLQEALLADPAQGLPGCQYRLADFQELLPQLHALVYEIQRPGHDQGGLTGSELLEVLHKHCLNGAPGLQSCFQRLQWHCNQVLFQQLTAWMVHGMLADEAGEFFIQPDAPRRAGSTHSTHSASEEERTYQDWHYAFTVDPQKLPPGVPESLAYSILFVGKAVRLLRAPAGSFKGRELLPHTDTLEFAAALGRLQAEGAFNQAALGRVVEIIRADVAARLWQLLVVQAGLMAHLAAAKDYLLLARGDFWQSFLVDGEKLLARPPREKTADADVAIPFQGAAAKSTAGQDPLYGLFTLHWSPEPLRVTAAHGGHTYIEVPAFDSCWDNLCLEFRLPWPLGVLLTPAQLQRYNALFQLLLRLKRVHMALEGSWQELGRMTCQRRGLSGCQPRDTWQGVEVDYRRMNDADAARLRQAAALLQLRHHMAHLVANLQVYLQVDVIESNYSVLEDSIAAAHDFSEAERAHEKYLHALVTQSFLSHASLCKQFGEVFSQARQLCGLIAGAEGDITRVDWEGVKAIRDRFNTTVGALYLNLQSKTLQQYDKAPHLRQLFMRLDFNTYISRQRERSVGIISGGRLESSSGLAGAQRQAGSGRAA